MRKIIAAALLPLAALLAAAKPVQDAGDMQNAAERGIFRATATAMCLTDRSSDPANRPANFGRVCSCAPERYLAAHPDGDLPAINAGNYRTVLAAEFAACSGGEAAAGGKTADNGAVTAPSVVEAPAAVPTAPDSTGAKPEGESMFAWLSNLSMPSVGGVPSWVWWAMIGLVVILLFARRVFRGSETRSDLDGPPRSMKPSAPVQPRHPNLPPRG